MDPLTLTIASAYSWGVRKSLDAGLRGLQWMTRETCKGALHWVDSKNPLMRFAGRIAQEAVSAETDADARRRVYQFLRTHQADLESLRKSLREEAAWQFDVSMDLGGIQGDVAQVLVQLSEMDDGIGKEIASLPQTLREELGFTHLHERIDRIHEILTRGLSNPLRAWQRYWRKMRGGIPWQHIETHPDAAYTVMTSFIGREAEMDLFEGFLTDDLEILHVYGEMGSGKSRWLHECAAVAERARWLVKFVENSGGAMDLQAAVQALREDPEVVKSAGLLLIWDDWQGEHADQARYFLGAGADFDFPFLSMATNVR
ncbi:MAG: ATP-binding protein [Planctomycetes bacterium]|nr:ATP-binding protein [Planctomycetota bacterium]